MYISVDIVSEVLRFKYSVAFKNFGSFSFLFSMFLPFLSFFKATNRTGADNKRDNLDYFALEAYILCRP